MIILYLAGMLMIFYLLAIICEKYFVSSLDEIAKKWRLSNDVAGATLMAVGSSAPEFFTSLFALTKVGSEQIGTGTIVGSAIFNILVIIGASSVVAKAYLNWRPVLRDITFYTISIIILLLTFQDGVITVYESLAYIGIYIAYVVLLSQWGRMHSNIADQDKMELVSENFEATSSVKNDQNAITKFSTAIANIIGKTFPKEKDLHKKYVVTFIISIAYIIALSWVLVDLAILTAHTLGIPEVIIALTIVAAGTSIPDLLSSLIVAKQGRGDMAVSNAVGSNIFDILICLGLPWFVYILYTGRSIVVSTENLGSSILLLFFTVISLLFMFILRKFHLNRNAGYFLLGLYGLYLVYAGYLALSN